MKRRPRQVSGWALSAVGGVLALVGVWGIGAYAWGVIDVLDEPDQSWIFWGLAILGIGIGTLGAGIGAIVLGRALLRR